MVERSLDAKNRKQQMKSVFEVDFTRRYRIKSWISLVKWSPRQRRLSPARYRIHQQAGALFHGPPQVVLGRSDNAKDTAYKSDGGLILKSSSSSDVHPSSFGIFVRISPHKPLSFTSIRVDTEFDWLDVDLDIGADGSSRFKGAIGSIATTNDVAASFIADGDTMVAASCQTAYDDVRGTGVGETAIRLNGPKLFVLDANGLPVSFGWTPFDSLRCSPIFGNYAGNSPAAQAPSSLEMNPFILSVRMDAPANSMDAAPVGLQLVQGAWNAPSTAPIASTAFRSTRFFGAQDLSRIIYAGAAINVTKPANGATYFGPIAARIKKLIVEVAY